jgi:hypothetical protein
MRGDFLQDSFTSGEWSPRLWRRSKLAKYENAVQVLENFCVLPQGGVDRRRGGRHVTLGYDQARRGRLIPFIFSREQAYVLEFALGGPLGGVVRFHTGQGGTPGTIVGRPERVENGTFDIASGSGWSTQTTGDGAVTFPILTGSTRGEIMVGPLGGGQPGFARLYQRVPVLPGKVHRLTWTTFAKFEADGGSGATGYRVAVGSDLGLADLVERHVGLGLGFTADFTPAPGITAVYVQFETSAPNTGWALDDVSVQTTTDQPIEVAHPYTTEAELEALQYRQIEDVLFVVHPAHPPYELRRYAHDVWQYAALPFTPPPLDEFGYVPATTLTPSGTTGPGVTFTAGASVFLASDVGRALVTDAGATALITAQAGTTCTADVSVPFRDRATLAAGTWQIDASPKAAVTPSAMAPIGAACTLTTDLAAWRVGLDEGKYVRLAGGVVRIGSVSSPTVAVGEVVAILSSMAQIAKGAWTLEESMFTAARGYPNAIAVDDQRLVLAKDVQFVGSVPEEYRNFRPGENDQDGYRFTVASGERNLIQWVDGGRSLGLGTLGTEFAADGGDADAPITPTSIRCRRQTNHGSAAVMPVQPGGAGILFVTKSRTRVRELVYNFDRDQYLARDLTALAEHIGRQHGGFRELHLQRDPDPAVWAVMGDGTLATLTYDPEQEVLAWARHFTGTAAGPSLVETACIVPNATLDADELWYVVQRTVNGAAVRALERIDAGSARYTDAHLYTVFGTPQVEIGGLDHLRGETVQVVIDGAPAGRFPVPTTGAATLALPFTGLAIEVGLPYRSRLKTLPLEGANPAGVSTAKRKRAAGILVHLVESLGLSINGAQVPFRTPGDPARLPLFTGDKTVASLGDGTCQTTIEIVQDEPLPCTITGIAYQLLTGDQ